MIPSPIYSYQSDSHKKNYHTNANRYRDTCTTAKRKNEGPLPLRRSLGASYPRPMTLGVWLGLDRAY